MPRENQPFDEAFAEVTKYKDYEQLCRDLEKARESAQLTPRDKAFLRGVILGKTHKEIAHAIDPTYSPKTVKDGVAERIYPLLKKIFSIPEEKRIESREISKLLETKYVLQIPLDPNFVGREEAINDLHERVKSGCRVIVIVGEGGIGKTTLAWEYLKHHYLKPTDLFIDCRMARETKDITRPEDLLVYLLEEYFGCEGKQKFSILLERLRKLLADYPGKVAIRFDNIEPALKNGKFAHGYEKYTDLIQMFADPSVKNVVALLTSREQLNISKVDPYMLEQLDLEAWKQYFENRNINVGRFPCRESSTLEQMHKRFGGNAEFMFQISGFFTGDKYDRNLDKFWERNNARLRDDFIIQQFDKLEVEYHKAYKLLCRLGCYRYQEKASYIPKEGVLCLLWDEPRAERVQILQNLEDRCLIKTFEDKYYLHPMIQAAAIARLRPDENEEGQNGNREEWERANREAAEFWINFIKQVDSIEDALMALEAYYHYIEIQDYEMAASVILGKRDNGYERGEPLGTSFQRLGLLQQITYLIEAILDKVTCEYFACYLCNILGDAKWLRGNILDAIKLHEKSRKLAQSAKSKLKNKEDQLSCERLRLVATFNQGLCKLDLGELEESLSFFMSCMAEAKQYVLEIGKREDFHSIPTRLRCIDLEPEIALYIAYINLCQGNEKQALEYIELSQPLTSRSDAWSQGYSLLYLGLSYIKLGNFEKARQTFNRAICFAEMNNYSQVKAKALTGLAEIFYKDGQFKEARHHYLSAIKILDEIDAKRDLAEAYFQLGLTYWMLSKERSCCVYKNAAIRLFESMEAEEQVKRVKQSFQQLDSISKDNF